MSTFQFAVDGETVRWDISLDGLSLNGWRYSDLGFFSSQRGAGSRLADYLWMDGVTVMSLHRKGSDRELDYLLALLGKV